MPARVRAAPARRGGQSAYAGGNIYSRKRGYDLPYEMLSGQESSAMNIRDSVAFVTGANRGLGLAFARELLARGAKTVYAGVRNPNGIDAPGLVPVKLDVTDPASVRAIAARCSDVCRIHRHRDVQGCGYQEERPTTGRRARARRAREQQPGSACRRAIDHGEGEPVDRTPVLFE